LKSTTNQLLVGWEAQGWERLELFSTCTFKIYLLSILDINGDIIG
jgi:hypothetical protein